MLSKDVTHTAITKKELLCLSNSFIGIKEINYTEFELILMFFDACENSGNDHCVLCIWYHNSLFNFYTSECEKAPKIRCFFTLSGERIIHD
jgi:hypothetical protein